MAHECPAIRNTFRIHTFTDTIIMTTGQGTGTGDYSVVNLRNWVRSESFGDDIGDGI